MSRDWTPKELDMVQKTTNMPNIVDQNWVIHIEGQEDRPMFSEEQIEISHKYPHLGMFGFDFLMACRKKGILTSEIGQKLVQEVEDMFNTGSIEDKEFQDIATQWYEGELVSGYDMSYNNYEFADYIYERMKKIEEGSDL